MKRVAALILFASLAHAESTTLTLDQKDGRVLTLDGSVELGVQAATSVLKAENQLHVSGADLLQAYGQFLPNLAAQGNYGLYRGSQYNAIATPAISEGRGANAGFSLTADLSIFNGLVDFANFRASTLRRDAADLTLKRARQQIALDVAQAFLQVVLDQRLIDIAQKNLQISRERERLLSEQTEVGARNLADLFRQQAETSVNESALLTAQNRERQDQVALLRRLRLDVNEKYHFVSPKLPETAADLKAGEAELLDEALTNRFDLKAARAQADAVQWDVKRGWSFYVPKLDLVAGMSGAGHRLWDQTVNRNEVPLKPWPSFDDGWGHQLANQIEYTAGLTLTWNLFDRFSANQAVQRARVEAKNAAIDAEDRRLQVQGEVRRAFGDYVTATQQLETSRKGLEAAERAYEVMSGRFEVGSVAFLDLITSQSTLVAARSQRVNAVVNFQLQQRSLSLAIGRL